ncbi:MAG: FCD domain-containing protein [Acetobacteraceae bacterium]|nr:FCD domain-containing protein [Acetobacteraceae bacterium]
MALATIRDIHEGFDLRLLLAPEATRRAAGRVDGDALRRLDAVCAAGYRPQDADSARAFLDANRAFHVAAADPFGNGASPARSAGCSTRARACSSSASSAATAAARWRASTPR